jgi:phosphoribosylglycinamide formyltransferase
MSKTRIAVLISGNGSNLQALIDDVDQKLTDTSIIRVISNRKGAFGFIRAEKAGIPTAYHNLLSYKRKYEGQDLKAREEYDADLANLILKDEPDLVVCAGFMHVLSPMFLEPLKERKVGIINLHPGMSAACRLKIASSYTSGSAKRAI